MNNICYQINDNKIKNNNIEMFIKNIKEDMYNTNNKLSLYTNYNSNYTIKELKHIIDYYNISFLNKKIKKKDIIEKIVDFELDQENLCIVNKRKQLWFYIKELNNDKYLSKYILIDV
mgnify:FL=1